MTNNTGFHDLKQSKSSFQRHGQKPIVYLLRTELSQILNVYGRMVSGGKWFDYAIDTQPNYAVFSVYRRASEMPLYQIIKEPSLASRQGAWRILSMNGQIVKRGKELPAVLRYFDNKLLKLID
ncbi:DUF2794 domain-containing protein [Kordiimonas sp. SCSIO 12610]|uniref:DUF2794 domain-containing protein n=1 Tax=Kordiimonas sp. SCSIO 12610 TaxID=2829597 RepID=UPI002109DC2E|nr:DUF2794 domain-containing protein [Kordiimonas sp. SCSIO 12610]UTW55727.1 DUF2794 domain-containing protein [Kordiimonas sp. SCSIO 12610]